MSKRITKLSQYPLETLVYNGTTYTYTKPSLYEIEMQMTVNIEYAQIYSMSYGCIGKCFDGMLRPVTCLGTASESGMRVTLPEEESPIVMSFKQLHPIVMIDGVINGKVESEE